MFQMFEIIISLQFEIIKMNFILKQFKNPKFSDLIMSICYKNLISLYSCIFLMKSGFLGTTKIIFRNVYESLEFWNLLNKYNHSTIYSQNFILELDTPEIENCNTIISVLLDMNFHLLNIFVSKYYNYYLNLYYNNNYYKEKKNKLKKCLKILRKLIDMRCKKVISDYYAKWII